MNKILIVTFLVGQTVVLSADTFGDICNRFGAKPGDPFYQRMMEAKAQSEKAIYNNLLQDVSAIVWKFAAIGQAGSTACSNYITNFLQAVGTPIAIQLLSDLKNGTASYKL